MDGSDAFLVENVRGIRYLLFFKLPALFLI
jgi:hypothetical protein